MILITFQCGAKCRDEAILSISRFVIYDGALELLRILVQNLQKRIWLLRALLVMCDPLDQLLVLAAELTNGQGSSTDVIGRAGIQKGGVKSHGLYIVQDRDVMSWTELPQNHLF